MRILQVNDYPLDHAAAGGAERHVDHATRLLRDRGHDVHSFTIADVGGPARNARRYIDNSIARDALCRRLHEFHPDIVHIHNIYHELSPGIMATLQRCRHTIPFGTIMTAHDAHLVCPNAALCVADGDRLRGIGWRTGALAPPSIWAGPWDHRGALYSWLKRVQHIWNYRLHGRHRVPDAVICPSRFLTALLTTRGVRAKYLPHPISSSRIETRRSDDGPLRVICVGRLAPEKGVLELLRSWPAPHGVTLEIIGDGPDADACRQCIEHRAMSDCVSMSGALPHAKTRKRIAKAHVLIVPSVCHENAPLVIYEALAHGTNVLLSDRGGLPEVIRDTSVGTLFEPDDHDTLTKALAAFQKQRADGTLNAFDIDSVWRERCDERWCDTLIGVYADAINARRLHHWPDTAPA
ncbi:MAG: glycosyltransferase [Planctomycetota bacterium]